MKREWITFITETGLKAKYQIVSEDLRHDVRIKILTAMPRGYYYSAQNEAGAYYDEHILPKLLTAMENRIKFKIDEEKSIHFVQWFGKWRCVFYYKTFFEGVFNLPDGELPSEETAKKYLPNFLETIRK